MSRKSMQPKLAADIMNILDQLNDTGSIADTSLIIA